MQYQTIIFDLDGVIINNEEGIINSIVHALEHFDIEVEDKNELRSFIGPPLHDTLYDHYFQDYEKAKKGVDIFREYYSEHGIFENKVIDGIHELLHHPELSEVDLYIATGKPTAYTERILFHFELDHLFLDFEGVDLKGYELSKKEILKTLLERNHHVDPREAVMIGDRASDIESAIAHNMDSIGVLFGFGSMEELEKAKPDAIAKNVAHLKEILLG